MQTIPLQCPFELELCTPVPVVIFANFGIGTGAGIGPTQISQTPSLLRHAGFAEWQRNGLPDLLAGRADEIPPLRKAEGLRAITAALPHVPERT